MSDASLHAPASPRAWLLGGLIASFYPFLGLKRLFSVIGIGLALYGIVLLVRRGRSLADNPAMRAALAVSLAFALPLLLALPDAAFLQSSLAATASSLLYLPILVGMIVLVQEQQIARPMFQALIITGVFWAGDGLLQLLLGHDLFGVPYNGERIGAYWQNQMKFGFYMGFFALFVVAAQAVLQPGRPLLLAALWLWLAIGVLISGSREAWLMFFPLSGLLFWVHIARASRYRWLILGAGLLMAVLLALGAYEGSPTVRERLAQSLSGMRWDYAAIDAASSSRLELWRIAVVLIVDNPVNGLGLDGYQQLFPSLVQAPVWLAKNLKEGPHPHQYLLEIGVATGMLGWAGLLAIVAVVTRAWRQASPAARAQAWPAIIYLVALWFPINTHRSFYSSELIMGNLLMMGLILGSLLPSRAVASHRS